MVTVLLTQDPFLIQTYEKVQQTVGRLLCVGSLEKINQILDKETVILFDFTDEWDEVTALAKRTKVFILTEEPNFMEGTKLLTLGVQGYANRYIAPEHLKDAVHVVKKLGHIWLYPEFIQEMITRLPSQVAPSKPKLDVLTSKEHEIASQVSQGFSNKEIALHLNITVRTVKAHLSAIFQKVGVADRLSLALLVK